MNLPNKLTVFRVILIPFFLVFVMIPGIPAGKWAAVGIFILASLTDLLDGKLARKYDLVTDFGKFMDPLADKLLVCSAMIALIELDRIPAWVVIIIIAREFTISGFRLIASDQGIVIAAGIWGKIKTTVQMLMVILLLLNLSEELPAYTGIITLAEQILIYASLLLTVISLAEYLWSNRSVLSAEK